MEFDLIEINGITIAKAAAEVKITSVDDALDLIGNCGYQGANAVILHQENLSPDFFDLKTGLAGEILQKFSNYRMQLAIVGNFTAYTSKSLQDFIRESNEGKLISFNTSMEEALSQFKV